MKPKVLMITDVKFWLNAAGSFSRISTLVSYLSHQSYLTVVVLIKSEQEHTTVSLPNINVIFLLNANDHDKKSNLAAVHNLLSFDNYKYCIIEYINHAYFLSSIPDHVLTMLDVHDIISDRNATFKELGYSFNKDELVRTTEYKIYSYFDYVIFISKKDYDKSLELLPPEKAVLAPHPVSVVNNQFREQAKVVGFIASDYFPNVDSITWFLENVWCDIQKDSDLVLHIYGLVCRRIPQRFAELDNVLLKGFIPDCNKIYNDIDIIINPVRAGAGIKIKNIEALANGLPLITTTHGSSGLEGGMHDAFVVADNSQDFKNKLIEISGDNRLRKRLATNAKSFIRRNFSEEVCFSKITDILATNSINNEP